MTENNEITGNPINEIIDREKRTINRIRAAEIGAFALSAGGFIEVIAGQQKSAGGAIGVLGLVAGLFLHKAKEIRKIPRDFFKENPAEGSE